MQDIEATLDRIGTPMTHAAKAIGISRSHLYDVVSRRCQPTAPVISRLLEFLNRPEHLERLGRTAPITFEELFSEAA